MKQVSKETATLQNAQATSAQENRNRYNERLNKVLQNISNTKETTTDTAPAPSKTRRTKATTPKALGDKIYKLYPRVDGAKTRNGVMCQDIIYHDPAGYAVVTDNKTVTASKLDYQEDHKGKAITVNGDEHPFGEALKTYRTLLPVSDEVYTIDLNSLKKSVQACKARGEYYTVLRYPDGTMQVTHTDRLLNALQIASKLQATKLTSDDAKIQLSSDYGLVLMACPQFSDREEDYHDGTEPHDPALDIKTIIDLTDVITATEDTTPTKPDTTQTDKPETPVQEPEEVKTEEDATPATATDDATLLRDLIDQYGNVGADYLDTLDYTQATEIRSDDAYILGRAKDLKQIEYRIEPADKNGRYKPFGLRRVYARNGKRMNFSVHNGWKCMESRAYWKNNNHYTTTIFYDDNKLKYLVKNGVIVEALLLKERGAIIHVHFNETNRPETPRDLPAPTPSKPTSKQAPTPETTTTPEEVQEVTTSKQEIDTTPYWLLIDQELQAQQEEQETALATPEKSEEEPMHAPQMLKKMIEEHKKRIKDGTATESIYNADALQAEVLTPKRAKELLGDNFSEYKTYILVDDTHIVETNRPTLKKTLYIDDESKEYKEYLRGNISKVELYRDDMMSMYGSKGKIKDVEDNPATLTVDETKDKVLSFNLYRRADYGYRKANPDEVAIYKAAMRANHEAFSKRLDSYLKRYGKKIYVSAYWANR